MKAVQKTQAGFTLIELVIVIVILGILAATALPKFVDLSSDAEKAAIKGVAGGLSSAAAINYAGCAVNSNAPLAGKCTKIGNCSDVGTLLNPSLTLGTIASSTVYYLAANTPNLVNGTPTTCTLKKDTGYSSDFTLISGGN